MQNSLLIVAEFARDDDNSKGLWTWMVTGIKRLSRITPWLSLG